MKFGPILKSLAPVFAVALAAGLAGCDSSSIKINGEEGKKLSELDLSGPVPDELAMFGPDRVELTQGDKLAITVDGDPEAVERVRFTLKDGTLGILRADRVFSSGGKTAVIHVTMPAPREVGMFGSGSILAPALGRDAKVVIAGSGELEARDLGGGKLDVTMPGSGAMRAAGNVDALELTILGSGNARLDAVRTPKAKVTIAGSGGAAFASDGEVDATIMGSGTVTVKGRARCTVSAMGSGKLVCEAGVKQEDAPNRPAPEPPAAPKP
ncbi:head GIN domain-containing protein [Novosphingobium sp.]|uniref:head GIN domain-containing protein n=1 Tax=Novosphingobium sp. TaxID=1874826 RepID=UPI00286B3A4D|nr:head GIN domain-containing protein [Novosphingobium sp.]